MLLLSRCCGSPLASKSIDDVTIVRDKDGHTHVSDLCCYGQDDDLSDVPIAEVSRILSRHRRGILAESAIRRRIIKGRPSPRVETVCPCY